MRRYSLLIFLLVTSMWIQPIVAQSTISLAGSIILNIHNEMSYLRPGWKTPLQAKVGNFLSVEDLVFPQNTSLLVLCPDGSLKDFVSGELFPNDKLNCAVPREKQVISIDSIQRVNVQRGGRQDPSIPYVIAPRGTLVRSSTLELRWNAPLDVLEYQVRIFSTIGDVLPRTRFLATDVTQGEIARTKISLNLQSNTAYIMEICATFKNLTSGCTTNASWSAGTNLAFYYVPEPHLGTLLLSDLETSIIKSLGENTPESLYARAVLLSQPTDHNLAFNNDAIDLLNHLISNFPDSQLAKSPDVYLRLGNLYRELELPRSSNNAFQKATQNSDVCTESAAQGYFGLAMTTTNTNTTVDMLNRSLENQYCLLNLKMFTEEYTNICSLVGFTCNSLKPLQEYEVQN